MNNINIKERQKFSLSFISEIFGSKMKANVYYNSSTLITDKPDRQNALLSAVLCESSYKKMCIAENMETLGFQNIKSFNYGEKKEDAADFTIGIYNNLLAIVVRGSADNEWRSNFDVGRERVHSGYFRGCNTVEQQLSSYIKEQKLRMNDLNFYLTGHSRGGAIVNLLAKDLIENYGSENVVAYTFSAPNTTTNKSQDNYNHIFNYVYADDFMAHCPIKKWGYSKYGRIIELSQTGLEAMTMHRNFKNLSGSDFKTFKDENQSIDSFMRCVGRLAPTVDDYYNKLFTVDEEQYSLYDYFGLVSDILQGENTFENGMTLYATLLSEGESITRFLIAGIDVNKLLKDHSLCGSCVAYAHTCITYVAYLM